MANKQMKRCSASLAIREMPIKTTVKHQYTPVRAAKTKNSDKDIEKVDHAYIARGDIKTIQQLWKTLWVFIKT